MNRYSKVVLYALDGNPCQIFFLVRSLRNLRRYNSKIPVVVVIFAAKVTNETRSTLRQLNVELIRAPEVPPFLRFFPKWLSLKFVEKFNRVLFLDNDTAINGDVDALFDNYSQKDFYARREMLQKADQKNRLVFSDKKVQLQIKNVAKKLGLKNGPVIFNGGVMIFNHKSHRRVQALVNHIIDIHFQFEDGRLTYPDLNRAISDELSAALAMSSLKNWKAGWISTKDVPFFFELWTGNVTKSGIVTHIWASAYHEFLMLKGERQDARKLRVLWQRQKVKYCLIPLSKRSTLPQKIDPGVLNNQ